MYISPEPDDVLRLPELLLLVFFQRVWGSFTKNALYKFTVIILQGVTPSEFREDV